MNTSTKRKWTQIGPGYHQLELPDWKSFLDYVYNDMLPFETYIWRGQRCDDWKLESTIDRLIRDAKVANAKAYDFQQKHLDQFKFAARGRRGSTPAAIVEENDWWALGQHHGLATPLLDWTRSPFVAAFFAFSEIGTPQTDHRAIFALHQPTVVNWSSKNQSAENERRRKESAEIIAGTRQGGLLSSLMHGLEAQPELVLVRPLSDENQRLVSQGGLFTRLHDGKSLETWVTKNHPEDDDGMSLLKILVPNVDRDVCLRTLNRMNINPLSLFPDLAGTSKYCNLFSEIENY